MRKFKNKFGQDMYALSVRFAFSATSRQFIAFAKDRDKGMQKPRKRLATRAELEDYVKDTQCNGAMEWREEYKNEFYGEVGEE